MTYFFSHTSALEFWRQPASLHNYGKPTRYSKPLPLPKQAHQAIHKVASDLGLSRPFSLVVPNPASRFSDPNLLFHCSSRQLSGVSFFRASQEALVSSPELCYLQLAGIFNKINLALLGYELCGTYRISPATSAGFITERPLTSTKQLKKYLQGNSLMNHSRNASSVMKHIADNSASPMESKLALILSLPMRLGGFGLPLPKLNNLIVDPETSKRFYCDLYWEGKVRVDLEYDSALFHSTPSKLNKDALRRTNLAKLGIVVLNCNYPTVSNPASLRKTAHTIKKLLGIRNRKPPQGYYEKQQTLHQSLFTSYAEF